MKMQNQNSSQSEIRNPKSEIVLVAIALAHVAQESHNNIVLIDH
jgi:hypothetical protein